MPKSKIKGRRIQAELDSGENNPNADNLASKRSNNHRNINPKTPSNHYHYPGGNIRHELNGGVLNTVVMQDTRKKYQSRARTKPSGIRPSYAVDNSIFSIRQRDYERNFPPLASKKTESKYPSANPNTNKFDWSGFKIPKFEWHNTQVKSLKNPLHAVSKEEFDDAYSRCFCSHADGLTKPSLSNSRKTILKKPAQDSYDMSDGFGWFIPF